MIDPYPEPELATAYQVMDGAFKQQDQSNDFFGFPDELFLSSDGMSLVRIASMASTLDGKKIEGQSVLLLHYKGQLIKRKKLVDPAENKDPSGDPFENQKGDDKATLDEQG